MWPYHPCGYPEQDDAPQQLVDHVNTFVNLHGMPYLVGEYADKRTFQQIDRDMIKSRIFVDTAEAMRTIVDIAVDDIGVRTDQLPNVIGNNTLQQILLNAVSLNYQRLEHQLPVLRPGIICRVNYQLENGRNHNVIRTMIEDIRIPDRSYFLDINPRNIDDNAIIINFADSMVSTINEFNHGRDPLYLRITSVRLYYEMLNNVPPMNHTRPVDMRAPMLPTTWGPECKMYEYHNVMQNHHMLYEYPYGCYGHEPVSAISNPKWTMFNRFYHFEDDGKTIKLHEQEIMDDMIPTSLVPCGSIHVNKLIQINPGQRIVFKFSIWKNDLVVVNDTTVIGVALRDPSMNSYTPLDKPTGAPPVENHHHHPDVEHLERMCMDLHRMNNDQNAVINELNRSVAALTELVSKLVVPSTEEDPDDQETPPSTDEPVTGDEPATGDTPDEPAPDPDPVEDPPTSGTTEETPTPEEVPGESPEESTESGETAEP